MFFKDDKKDPIIQIIGELTKRVGRINFSPYKVVVQGDSGPWHQTETSSIQIVNAKDETAKDIAALASKINEQQKQINKLNNQLIQVVDMLNRLTVDLSDDISADYFVDK